MNRIDEYLALAGVTNKDPDWGLQYNLCHASLSDLGVRCGLDPRVRQVLEDRGLGKITEEGRLRILRLFLKLYWGLKGYEYAGSAKCAGEEEY